MKKKLSQKYKFKFPVLLVAFGLLLLTLTPFVADVSYTLLSFDCPKNTLGECPFEKNYPYATRSAFIAILWGVVAAVILSIGVYLKVKSKK